MAAVADGEIDLIPANAGFSHKRFQELDFSPASSYIEVKILSKKSSVEGQVRLNILIIIT